MQHKIEALKEEIAERKMLAARYGYADGLDICKITEPELHRRLLDRCEPKGLIWDWQESVILDLAAIDELRAEVEAMAKEEDEL